MAKASTFGAIVVLLVWAGLAVWPCPADPRGANRRKPLPSGEEIAKLPPDGGAEFNRLIHETSPYLLQHARNPVDWYPWGPEALAKAKKHSNPIFLSVGYSTCHWCHVMERESFENPGIAKILNEHFVAIKVDREERPDVDRIYMLATQLMTGRGGWPNSVWLTPDGKPWYAGTYFPPDDRFGQPGFKTLLTRLAEVWRTRRKDMAARADEIAKAIGKYSAGKHVEGGGKLSADLLRAAAKALAESFDERNGGFGGAPKFPPHGSLRLLLAQFRRTKDTASLKMATRTLDAMAHGGIHDHVGGGFHRYATDAAWLVPHFEKMLYDNAQLARAYVEAYLATRNEEYKRVAVGIFEWVLREMTDEAGGLYSALDADSEGEEGKFYLWHRKEILEIAGKAEGELFCGVYGVRDEGNFRDPVTGERPGNILHLTRPVAEAAEALGTTPAKLRDRLSAVRRKLLARRAERVWPHRDDKVLVSWNALMIGSLAYGGRHLSEPRYTAAAEKAADFILTRMQTDGRLMRTYRQGKARLSAYLDDYAFLADALVELHEATGRKRRLDQAVALAETMLKHYRDPAGGGFFFTAADHPQKDLLVRTKDPMDAAVPAGNGVAAQVLVRLARLTGAQARDRYLQPAKDVLEAFQGFMARVPGGTASLLLAAGAYLDATAGATDPGGPKPDAVAEKKPVTVEAFASRLTAAPGETIDLAVRITIDKGWHVNSNRPLGKDLIATTVRLKDSSFAALGRVEYPKGKEVKFAFSPEALSVYEGTVWIRASVELSKAAKAGPASLALEVGTQACNDRSCLTPETHALSLTVDVDPNAKAGRTRHPSVFRTPG